MKQKNLEFIEKLTGYSSNKIEVLHDIYKENPAYFSNVTNDMTFTETFKSVIGNVICDNLRHLSYFSLEHFTCEINELPYSNTEGLFDFCLTIDDDFKDAYMEDAMEELMEIEDIIGFDFENIETHELDYDDDYER